MLSSLVRRLGVLSLSRLLDLLLIATRVLRGSTVPFLLLVWLVVRVLAQPLVESFGLSQVWFVYIKQGAGAVTQKLVFGKARVALGMTRQTPLCHGILLRNCMGWLGYGNRRVGPSAHLELGKL